MIRNRGIFYAVRSFASTPPPKRDSWKIRKLLIANRGEISVRINRACQELDIRTLAIYSEQDSAALHRVVADESVMVGKNLTPVGAYLNVEEIIEVALKHNCDAIHPGYGFLSERGDFAKAVEDAGIMFVGPHYSVMDRMGDKIAARETAIEAGVPVIPGIERPLESTEQMLQVVKEMGLPVMLKAAYGGGGRGMRKVYTEDGLTDAYERAVSEAVAAFGNGAMFVEKLVEGARHIEVQLMGDHHGRVVHLFERDCSVQRRHQKVIEIAPAPFFDEGLRQRIFADSLKLANHVGYQNAGTVEFLVDVNQNTHYFIEVNARLQVEHTVSEEVTGVDLVKTQIGVREGKTLEELNVTQLEKPSGYAIQCRVTTEDSQKDFMPDTGRIDFFRPATGYGVRLDGAIAASGAIVSPYYDSLLVKITSRARTFEEASARSVRALTETRIRGVTTNIPFILNVFKHPDFISGNTDTKFIDLRPELFQYDSLDYSSQSICRYLANVIVNGPMTSLVNKDLHPTRTPAIAPIAQSVSSIGAGSWGGAPEFIPVSTTESRDVQPGWKQVLEKDGPHGVRKKLLATKELLLTDTTTRDAHQSLFATRMRTYDMIKAAHSTSVLMPQLFSLENWGGATFDVSYRFLRENPWERLEMYREEVPNMLFQMLLRGANAVGYTAYPDNAVHKFCDQAVRSGMDVFRIFDSLNYVENMKLGIQAVGSAGGIVEAAISYTGDVGDPNRGPYDLDYYLELARQLSKEDVHILCIKDMAGLLTPRSADILVRALRTEFPHLPIHVHTHDTAATGVSSMLAASAAGASVVDCAIDSLAGLTSQPSMGAIVNSLRNTERDTGIEQASISAMSDYWEHVRGFYSNFEATATLKSGSSDVYVHEIPGGQYTNLHMQAWSLGMADQWKSIKDSYAEANKALGDIVKVTPSSKVVGDLAQFMVANDLTNSNIVERAEDLSFPSSVVEYFQGYIGQPPFGFPKELQQKVLKGKPVVEGRPGASLAPIDWDELRKDLEGKYERKITDKDLLSYVMYPKVLDEYEAFRKEYGDVSVLPTAQYFTGMIPGEEITITIAGREVTIKYITQSSIFADNTRDVFFEVMGLPRKVNVEVAETETTKGAASVKNAKAEAGNSNQIGAPMPGQIVEFKVSQGQTVEKGQPLLVLSAMKMETVVVAPKAGVVDFIPLTPGSNVQSGDLLICLK